jgi:uncharacterized protein (TIGR04255 family)
MAVKLRKAPLIEIWIGFRFDPSPQKRGWAPDEALQFIKQFSNEFPAVEALHQSNVTVQKIAADKLPQVVEEKSEITRLRSKHQSGDRLLQISDDLLVYNAVGTGSFYPGFASFRDEAVRRLEQYRDFFHPVSLQEIAIHYIDVVEVSSPSTLQQSPDGRTKFDLSEFFKLDVKLPDPFGATERFFLMVNTKPDSGPQRLMLTFGTDPVPDSEQRARFRMEWHVTTPGPIDCCDIEKVKGQLDAADELTFECFRQSFTDQAWQTFDPIEVA